MVGRHVKWREKVFVLLVQRGVLSYESLDDLLSLRIGRRYSAMKRRVTGVWMLEIHNLLGQVFLQFGWIRLPACV